MSISDFPFLEPFLEAKRGTLYVLSDAHVRLRDPAAIITLAQFFAEHGVEIDIRPELARHRRLFDRWDFQLAMPPGSDGREKVERLIRMKKNVGTLIGKLDDFVKHLFDIAQKSFQPSPGDARGSPQSQGLASRGPILLLGRPALFPEALRGQIAAELTDRTCGEGLLGRFRPKADKPAPEKSFWTIEDTYFGGTMPPATFFEDEFKSGSSTSLKPRTKFLDYAVVRMVGGKFVQRVFLLVYGASSLGTLGGAQAIVDEYQNESLRRAGAREFFEKHGFAEVLLRVSTQRPFYSPWLEQFDPKEIELVGTPCVPPSRQARDLFNRFRNGTKDIDDLYHLEHATRDTVSWKVIRSHPTAHVWTMIGGTMVAALVNELQRLAKSGGARAVLLVGETGTGKELAARVLYETWARHVLEQLQLQDRSGAIARPAIVAGPRWIAHNCAVISGGAGLPESQLFGVTDKWATGVAPNLGAFLAAGEGVLLLDELESMPKSLQATLLRALQPPFRIKPVGYHMEVPYSALVIASTNVDPEQLVADGKLRSDLYARLRNDRLDVPPLREHPGDVPALLAWIARGSIRLDDQVLRCLLMGTYPHNVRDLFGIVSRAKARPQAAGRPLEIALGDLELDSDIRMSLDAVDQASGQAELVFEAKVPSSALEDFFDAAVGVLASVQLGKSGPQPRQPSRDFEQIWPGKVGQDLCRAPDLDQRVVRLYEDWLQGSSEAKRLFKQLLAVRAPKKTKVRGKWDQLIKRLYVSGAVKDSSQNEFCGAFDAPSSTRLKRAQGKSAKRP